MFRTFLTDAQIYRTTEFCRRYVTKTHSAKSTAQQVETKYFRMMGKSGSQTQG